MGRKRTSTAKLVITFISMITIFLYFFYNHVQKTSKLSSTVSEIESRHFQDLNVNVERPIETVVHGINQSDFRKEHFPLDYRENQADLRTPVDLKPHPQSNSHIDSKLHLQLQNGDHHTPVVSKPHPQNGGCKDVLCTECLTEQDWNKFAFCREKAVKKLAKQAVQSQRFYDQHLPIPTDLSNDPLTSGGCTFMNGSGRGVIGLISFPGSGNTWVRGMLQSVTGICTGAVYCDGVLRSHGFDGEGVQSSSVLVVKEHTPVPKWTAIKNVPQFDRKKRPHYDKVIFIVRNPFHALVSEWNRQLSTKYGLRSNINSSHTDSFGQEYFGAFNNWTYFVEDRLKKWVSEFNWLLGCPSNRDVMLVRYEDLKVNLTVELKRMLRFIPYQFKGTDSEMIHKAQSAQFNFHRSAKLNFEHFTPDQQKLIHNSITMSDLTENRQVSSERGRMFAEEHGLKFMETSAMTGENVELAFMTLANDIILEYTQRVNSKDYVSQFNSRSIPGVFDANRSPPPPTNSTCC